MNFWQNLDKPIVGLSPMDGVTDAPYRMIQAKYAKPDVIITEFIPVEGIVRLSERLLRDFLYSTIERPVVAQIYGNDPELFYASVQLVCELGFDGLDINMGCPAKSVVHRGCGAALINTPKLAQELVRTSKQAVADWVKSGVNWSKWPPSSGLSPAKAERLFNEFVELACKLGIYEDWQIKRQQLRLALPVSVKTRVGYNQPIIEQWLPTLLEVKPVAISIHGRTLKQGYTGSADWALIAEAVNIRNQLGSSTLILGNGDIKSGQIARQRVAETKADGLLIGKATYGNPWIINEAINALRTKERHLRPQALSELFPIMLEHAKLHEQLKPTQAFVQIRKNMAWYISGVANAAKLRSRLVRAATAAEIADILNQFAGELTSEN